MAQFLTGKSSRIICLAIYMWWHILGGWAWLTSFVIAWFITNGWAYIFVAVGGALRVIGAAWLAILWLPMTPEKIVTVAIAAVIKKLLFRPRVGDGGKYETSNRSTVIR